PARLRPRQAKGVTGGGGAQPLVGLRGLRLGAAAEAGLNGGGVGSPGAPAHRQLRLEEGSSLTWTPSDQSGLAAERSDSKPRWYLGSGAHGFELAPSSGV